MTRISSGARFAFLTAIASIAVASPRIDAQQTPIISLTLGDAARLAARQSALARGARLRADEAEARVRQRKADLLPTVSSYVQEAGRTFNTSTLGIEFPTPPGQQPIFDPAAVRGLFRELPDRTPAERAGLDGLLNRILSLTLMHQRFGMSV